MRKICIPIKYCNIGEVLAEDIDNDKGVILAAKNTIMNEYVKNKLIELNVSYVWLYEPEEISVNLGDEKEYKKVKRKYNDIVLSIKKFINKLSTEGSIDYHEIKGISERVLGSMDESSYLIRCLSEIRSKDEYTYTHCINVSFYAMLIAKWLHLSEDKMQEVIQTGILHDIGKTRIPNNILNKKGKYLPDEFEIMKMHPTYGYELIKDSSEFSMEVKEGVLSHHERVDGSGYPKGLINDSIGLYAKIIAIVDVYDAMTQNRVYKNKVTPFDAFEMFLTIGISGFDTRILNTFLKNLSVYYIGSKVLLNNGEIGEIVFIPPHNIICPVIRVMSDYIDLSTEKLVKIVQLV